MLCGIPCYVDVMWTAMFKLWQGLSFFTFQELVLVAC